VSRHHNHHGPGVVDFLVWTLLSALSWLLVVGVAWGLIALGYAVARYL
jgi:hypothetical protein